jgi:DNA invertase Pin-like site-specific DNA recombinase
MADVVLMPKFQERNYKMEKSTSKQVKVIAYCRVDISNQTKENRYIENQKRLIIEAAKRWDAEIVKWFVQVGYEPVSNTNSVLDRALDYCGKNPDIDCVAVASPERISREEIDQWFWMVTFRRNGTPFIYVDLPEVDESPESGLVRILNLEKVVGHESRSGAIKLGLKVKKEGDE